MVRLMHKKLGNDLSIFMAMPVVKTLKFVG